MNKNIMLNWLKHGHVTIPKILLKHYHEIGLNEKQLILLLNVYMSIEEGRVFPTPEQLAKQLPFTVDDCAEMLNQLKKNSLIQICQSVDENGVIYEYYSLDRLWEKLLSFLYVEEQEMLVQREEKKQLNLYTIFEQEFGRPLSPIECEMLSMWLDEDHHSPEIIKAALKEAVISGKLNFRYIDRILFEWKKNGIETLEQAKAFSEKIRGYQQQKTYSPPSSARKKAGTVPAYNWLEQ